MLPGPSRSWFIQNGFLSQEGTFDPAQTSDVWMTTWTMDGQVRQQVSVVTGEIELITEPPWRWRVEHQTEPTAPWSRRGVSCDDWWQELSEKRKVEF